MYKKISYQYSDKLKNIKQWVNDIESKKQPIALDFETTGLGHPSKEIITHLSIANNSTNAYVCIIKNKLTQIYLLDWITTTDILQLWHNLSYDGKFIYYYTGKLPKHFIDTQLLAKILLNHVETYKAKTGLKNLCASVYGAWGINEEMFTIKNLYNEKLLKYAAIDACATYYIYEEMKKYI